MALWCAAGHRKLRLPDSRPGRLLITGVAPRHIALSWENRFIQGGEPVDRERLDADSLVGHLIAEDSMFAFLAALDRMCSAISSSGPVRHRVRAGPLGRSPIPAPAGEPARSTARPFDPNADGRPLNYAARGRIDTEKIALHWEHMCRVAVSIHSGEVSAHT